MEWATFVLLWESFHVSGYCNYTNCSHCYCGPGHLTFLPSCQVCSLPEPMLSVKGICGPSRGIHTLHLSILQLTMKITLYPVIWYSRVVSKMSLCNLERTNALSLHTNKRWRGLSSGSLPAHSNSAWQAGTREPDCIKMQNKCCLSPAWRPTQM